MSNGDSQSDVSRESLLREGEGNISAGQEGATPSVADRVHYEDSVFQGRSTYSRSPHSAEGYTTHSAEGYTTQWKKIREELREEIDPQVYQAYIRPLQFVRFHEDHRTLSLAAPSRFVRQHVDSHFDEQLKKKCIPTFGEKLSIEYEVSDEAEQNAAPKGGEAPSDSASPPASRSSSYVVVKKTKTKGIREGEGSNARSDDSGLMPRYTFENFVVGSGNQFCHAASLQVAEAPGNAYNPLFIYGGVGLGKTHLLHAIGNGVLSRSPEKKVLYLSSESFTNELILALRYAKMDEFKNRFRNIDLLLIDDIQFMCGKERTQEEFFHTFNALYSAKHQIVITSDKVPQDIPGIEERLQTRFAWGLTADIQAPDYETRVAILKRKASLERFQLPEKVAHLIAESVSSNVRELEGALTRLHALSSLQHLDITPELAESALRPILKKKKVHLSIDDIQKGVAEHFSIRVSEMVSKRRTKNLSFPRHIAMYLCRKHTTSSYPEIGAKFGGRDHSSVIHAANVVTTKVKAAKEEGTTKGGKTKNSVSEEIQNHIHAIEQKLFQ
ncbi:chromosomal replication initiator protein DnaA [bacterium]|nr:chromosomal replication initiator protein DnaA [bacterium]